MSSITKRIAIKRRKEAVGALRQLADRINKYELDVVEIGLWEGGERGRWNFKLVVKETPQSEDSRNS